MSLMRLALPFACALATLAPPAMAETLKVPVSAQGSSHAAVDRPHRGQTMAGVEARFGAPASRRGPVGKPPITRWEYSEFYVVFEGTHVLHSVLKPTPGDSPTPAPVEEPEEDLFK